MTIGENTADLVRDLRKAIGPENVLSDFAATTAYAIDASIYKIRPTAVALPRDASGVEAVLATARRHGVPLTPRAGGTNLAGNAVGEGIVLDVSRMRDVVEVSPERAWVRVQPGLVCADLDRRLAPIGCMFAPDPSSAEMCKIGGMVGNNAAGPHTLKYGSVKDNLIELDVLLSDGARVRARPIPLSGPEEAGLHPALRNILDLVRTNLDLIRSRRRHVTKNSSGYNLFGLVDGLERGVFDLPRLFAGSEGTLGIVLEAKLRLVPRPRRLATALIYLERLADVGEATRALLDLAPSALELMDRNALDLVGRDRFGVPPSAQAMLLMELDAMPAGRQEEPLDEKMARAKDLVSRFALSRPVETAEDEARRLALWSVRKALYPTLYRYDLPAGRHGAGKKPINFCDDVVVPAERIPDLIPYLEETFGRIGTPVAIYGHIGDGNAHINPLMNLNDEADFKRMIAISREIHQAVIHRFEGSICGEHGDGRVRAEYVRELYGDDLYELFRRVKRILDPGQLLNPGVKITAAPFTEHVDLERQAKPCATCGRCNAVCPVYDVVVDESNAARGWFHIVTAQDYSYDAASRAVEACLNCKSCRTVCPAGIDVSDWILKRRAERPNRATRPIFALHARPVLMAAVVKFLGKTQPAWDRPAVRRAIDRLTRPFLRRVAPEARLASDVILPRIAGTLLRERHRAWTEEGGRSGTIGYFHGCAANYFQDGVGDATIGVLKRLGVDFVLPNQRCSGTPIQTYGHTDLLLAAARFNVQSLARYDRILTSCASCTFMLKEYPSLFPNGPEMDAARRLASKTSHITEYLVNDLKLSIPSGRDEGSRKVVAYHSSCHLRAAGVTAEPRALLSALPGYTHVEMEDADRCAGGAGTYLIKNDRMSRAIFDRKRRAVEKSGAEVVATSCPACMIQLRNGLDDRVAVRHVIQLVAEALGVS